MIEIRFRGWFQVRLATDPDPYDEPRGVSGYVHAYAGEPDLDRVISFQPPAFTRPHGRPVGVVVDQVARDGAADLDHPLVGAAVDLLDEPKFEGRNGVIGDDGFEPVYPFRMAVEKGAFRVVRSVVPADPTFPYDGLFPGGIEIGVNEVSDATGENGLAPAWTSRIDALVGDLAAAEDPHRTGIAERLDFLRTELALGPRGATRFFFALMRYGYVLASPPELTDPGGWLDGHDDPATPWTADFWLGGWDADALCGYVRGTLRLPGAADPDRGPARVTDRRP
jgi:hypothetical protein